jgi:hypothetical protein
MGIAADDVILVAGAIATAATLLQIHFTGGIGAALGRLPQLSGRRSVRVTMQR